jgi:predicted outer membrane protein
MTMQTWKRSLWSAALAFILAAPVVAQDGTDAPVETGDVKSASASSTELLATLQHVNKMEIEAGELAQQKGQSEGVKKYGETLEKD